MPSIQYNHQNIAKTTAEMHAAASSISESLSEMSGLIGQMAGLWHGAGSQAWQAEQQRWNTDANQLNEAVREVVASADQASQSMSSTDGNVASMFGG